MCDLKQKKSADDTVLTWITKDWLQDHRIKKYIINNPYFPFLKFGGAGLLSLYLIFGYGAQLICNIIAFVYPSYCSIKALETPRKEDDVRWLTYWVVFALFSVVEFFSDLLLSWFPLYWLAKCMFLVWCFLPITFNGSNVIYGRIVKPVFLKHESKIDEGMNKVTNLVDDIASTMKSD